MVRLLQAFFRWFALTLPALFVPWIAFFGYVLDFLYRQSCHHEVFLDQILQQAETSFPCVDFKCPLNTHGSGMYRNPSFLPGPHMSVFDRLHNCMSGPRDKPCIDAS